MENQDINPTPQNEVASPQASQNNPTPTPPQQPQRQEAIRQQYHYSRRPNMARTVPESKAKQFWMNVLSSTVGCMIGAIVLTVVGIFLLVNLISALSSTEGTPAVMNNSVLRIPLTGVMVERNTDDEVSALLETADVTVSLDQVLTALHEAKDEPNVSCIFLDAGPLEADPASLQEIRRSLEECRKAGKLIVAYADHYTQGAYYLCSIANTVVLNPSGLVDWKGLSAQPMFYTDLMAKVGVKMQVFKVGTYKSAVEPYTQTQMSEANKEQVNSYIKDIWQTFVDDVSKSRKIPADSLNRMADRYMGLAPAKDIQASRLVDTLMYKDDLLNLIKTHIGVDADDDLNIVLPDAFCNETSQEFVADNTIAVYYAEGEIVDYAALGLGADAAIDAGKMIKDLKKLQDNDNIKAVVLRINSGGGSAYASEQIWHAIRKLQEKKTVVVSMGGMAASGAYYMSVGAKYIFAEPTTLTGSIGIFGLIPDVSNLMTEKLGLKFDVVKTNQMADMGSMSRPLNEQECKLMQGYIENGYQLFLGRVAEGRKMTTEAVDDIAQGRVWTGNQALQIKLVDKLGTLQDAINYAARKAGIQDDYKAVSFPELEPWYISLGLSETEAKIYNKNLRNTLGDLYEPAMSLRGILNQSHMQARLPYKLKIV